MRRIITLGLPVLLTLLVSTGLLMAQPDGTLDKSYLPRYISGQTVSALCYPDGGTPIAIQHDGKVLYAGKIDANATLANKTQFLIRINPDGSYDKAFDQNLPTISGARGASVHLQQDGGKEKILFSSNTQFFRFNPDGTQDNSFSPAYTNGVWNIEVQPTDQKILICRDQSTAPYLTRLNPDGTLDQTFRDNLPALSGRVFVTLPQKDGKIVVAGSFKSAAGTSSQCIIRLNADGTLDNTFNQGGEGLVLPSYNSYQHRILELAQQSDGKYIVVGGKFVSYNGTALNTGVIRLNTDGTLDNTFNQGKAGSTGPASNYQQVLGGGVTGVIVLSDDKIIIVGPFDKYNDVSSYGIARLNADGTLDPSFVVGSGCTNATGALSPTFHVAQETDTTIVISGQQYLYNGDTAYVIARLKNTIQPTAPTAAITDIKLDPNNTSYCKNVTLKVDYKATGTYNAGNKFTVQLSAAGGSFANPTDIGSVSATTATTINATIPGSAATGNGYRIRVVSSDPAVVGDDNGIDFTINALDVKLFDVNTKPVPPEICEGDSVTLTGTYTGNVFVLPNINYTWDNGITNNKAFAPTSTKTYEVTISTIGCTTTRQVTVTVKPSPTVTAKAQPDKVCKGEQTVLTEGGNADSYSWDNGVTGGTAFTPGATETYTVTGTAANGCTDTAQVTVTVNPLPTVTATANPGTDICEGNEVTLNGGGADTYSWDKNVTDGKAFVPTQTETYTVIGTDASGCENTTDITVNVKDTSIVAVADTICFGDTYTLGTQTLDKTGTYTEVFVAANGCDSTVNLALTVNTVDVSITQNGNELKATDGATSYQWIDCKDNQPIAGATNQTYRSTEAGDFAVVVTSGDCTDTSVCYHLEGEHAGISGNSFSHQVTLYPNPNHGQMTITSGSALTNATVRVINVVGQTVKEINHLSGNSFGLDISTYAAGIYYVEIRDGAQTARVKFTKE